jgi:hypothetical protein
MPPPPVILAGARAGRHDVPSWGLAKSLRCWGRREEFCQPTGGVKK